MIAESPGEYKDKLRSLSDLAGSGSLRYEEEFIIDQEARTSQCIMYVNGEKTKDYGAMKCGVELDHTSNDGRPSKVRKRTQTAN